MDYSQDLTNNDQEIDSYKTDSLPYLTAEEESELWRKIIKWRCIKQILGWESIPDDISKADTIISYIVILQIAKEIGISHNLVASLRHHAGLEELGDTIIEDAENNTNITIELYRRIQYSKKKHDDKTKRDDGETCCLEDLFGFILGEILNNIAFGKGNLNLVDKITKAINDNQVDIRDKLYRLAVNRELLPRSLIKLINPKAPLNKLPILIENIHPERFTECVLNDYQSFILNTRLEAEKAFNEIIESHLRLVVNIVNKFITKDSCLPNDDLIQEGSIGLIEAAESYNPAYGNRFKAYATRTIHQMIYRAIPDKTHIIHLPGHMIETISELLRVTHRLAQEYGREPTAEEISQRMGLPLERIREIVTVEQLPVSLESHIDENEDNLLDEEGNRSFDKSIIDMIDKNALSMTDAVAEKFLKEQIEEVLDTLTFRERRVIELRFGLVGGRKLTLEEVGKEFGVTRERIRQIEDKALRRLRHPSRSRKLKDYLE